MIRSIAAGALACLLWTSVAYASGIAIYSGTDCSDGRGSAPFSLLHNRTWGAMAGCQRRLGRGGGEGRAIFVLPVRRGVRMR